MHQLPKVVIDFMKKKRIEKFRNRSFHNEENIIATKNPRCKTNGTFL